GELMAHDQWRRAVAHVPEVALDLGAADADRGGPQHQLARSRRRLGPLLDRHPLRSLPDDRLHATSTILTSSPKPVIAIRTSSPAWSVNSGAGMTEVPVSRTAPTGKSWARNSQSTSSCGRRRSSASWVSPVNTASPARE